MFKLLLTTGQNNLVVLYVVEQKLLMIGWKQVTIR